MAHDSGEEDRKADVSFSEFEDVEGAGVVDGGKDGEEKADSGFGDAGAGGEEEDVVGGGGGGGPAKCS